MLQCIEHRPYELKQSEVLSLKHAGADTNSDNADMSIVELAARYAVILFGASS